MERKLPGKDRFMREKLKDFFGQFSLRSLWDVDDEDYWEDFDSQDDYISGKENKETGPDDESGAESGKKGISLPAFSPYMIWVLVAVLAVIAIVAYQVSSRRHLYTDYKVLGSYKSEDVTGTSYVRLGNDFAKYGADGITLVNASNQTLWSSAYTMQTTVADHSGESILIYEQQGNQVLVANKDSVLGQFSTDMPILKGSVAANGICALLMKNEEDTLIRLFSPDGTTLAEVKPTLEETGQPIALDLSDDATRLMVSMVRSGAGTVDSSIVFYDFSSTSESAEEHISGQMDYSDVLFPDVFLASGKTPVAVGDDRIVIFSGVKDPKEKSVIDVDTEITSVLHDDKNVGIICPGTGADQRYHLMVWNLTGKKTIDTDFNESYDKAGFDSGEILLWSQGHMMAYAKNGVKRLDCDFDGRIEEFVKIPGFRRYCVLSNFGMTRIEAE